MPTITQLRQDISSKENQLNNYERDLRNFTMERATQQRKVTIKEDKIYNLTNKSNLTTVENQNLATLKREIDSDKRKLENRNRKTSDCSQKRIDLMYEISYLKSELKALEITGALDYSSRSFRR